MKSTPVKLTEPYAIDAVVEKPDGLPAYLASVEQILVPFGPKQMDVTFLVLSNDELCRQLEDMVMTEYLKQQMDEIHTKHADIIKWAAGPAITEEQV